MSATEELKQKFVSGELQYKKENEIYRLLGVSSRAGRDAVRAVLAELLSAGELVRDERGRFVSPEKLSLIKGVLSGNERGFAFLVREEGDLFIPHRSLHGAQHKDTVFARIVGGERGDEAEVYSILSRGVVSLTGTYYKEERGGYVSPDDKKYFEDVRVVGGRRRAFSGEKVLVKITAWPEGRKPEGEIEEVLGRGGDLSVEEEALIRTYGLAEGFTQKVLSEGRRVAAEKMPLAGRRDFRDVLTITIDGEDARDFDDAISIEKLEDGFLLGVHIADVSHYVRRGGALDREAYARGTSVYFPDRVLPMLPFELSNGICSLREGEDRLTLSCVMRVDQKGRVTEPDIAESVIRSRNRMTYTNVTKILDGDPELCERYAHLVPMLQNCRKLAQILMRKRAARGSVVDIDALKTALDQGQIAGAAIDVFPKEPADKTEEFISPLRNMPNVILTPHIGGSTLEAQANIGLEVAERLVKYSDNGSTLGAVNCVEVSLPVQESGKTTRFMHIHKNVPGVLSSINGVFSANGLNVSGQYLRTDGEYAYVVVDVDGHLDNAPELQKELEKINGTLKVRYLF